MVGEEDFEQHAAPQRLVANGVEHVERVPGESDSASGQENRIRRRFPVFPSDFSGRADDFRRGLRRNARTVVQSARNGRDVESRRLRNLPNPFSRRFSHKTFLREIM